jgi:hypothetical protein
MPLLGEKSDVSLGREKCVSLLLLLFLAAVTGSVAFVGYVV